MFVVLVLVLVLVLVVVLVLALKCGETDSTVIFFFFFFLVFQPGSRELPQSPMGAYIEKSVRSMIKTEIEAATAGSRPFGKFLNLADFYPSFSGKNREYSGTTR